jgi:hypothetical protein
MHIRYLIGAAILATLAVAACDRMPAPVEAPGDAAAGASAETGFSHATTADISGYYMPAEPVSVGKWGLNHIFVGQASEFETWERGAHSDTFAPVMIEFDDTTSPMVDTEQGEARGISVRVLPTRYEVTDTTVSFDGQSAELGAVTFVGRLDPEALATSKRNLGGEEVVLTGTLAVGGQTARDVRLRWWMGD